jgi:hypothetical protein
MAIESIAFIYYTVPDRAFERAARWYVNLLSPGFATEFVGVRTKQDFINAWNGIRQQAINNNAVLRFVGLFTHASKGDTEDGLEFADGPGGSTLSRADIQALPRMPWAPPGYSEIDLFGCNTGLTGSRGWSPAEAFANSQGVKACGQTGFAYFSRNMDQYEEISASDTEVYLGAYRRGRNGPTGNGEAMLAQCFNWRLNPGPSLERTGLNLSVPFSLTSPQESKKVGSPDTQLVLKLSVKVPEDLLPHIKDKVEQALPTAIEAYVHSLGTLAVHVANNSCHERNCTCNGFIPEILNPTTCARDGCGHSFTRHF